jgi:uncharacterized metal-binding protein
MADSTRQENTTFSCECNAEDIIFLPCAGGSNCGQITNHAAVNLDIEKVGHIYCLAGISAHIDGMVESAKTAKRIVAIDGCQVACAKKAIEHAGLMVTDWICVTNEGISKNHEFMLDEEENDLIEQRIKESLSRSVAPLR